VQGTVADVMLKVYVQFFLSSSAKTDTDRASFAPLASSDSGMTANSFASR